MVAAPLPTPVIIPVVSTVAAPVLLQTPPHTLSVSVVVAPAQTVDEPEIEVTLDGNTVTCMG